MSGSSPDVFIVVDPVQDYEESLTILGVHGSLEAAKKATRRYRRTSPCYSHGDNERRDTEVQRWKGGQLLDVWTFSPNTDNWTWTSPERRR